MTTFPPKRSFRNIAKPGTIFYASIDFDNETFEITECTNSVKAYYKRPKKILPKDKDIKISPVLLKENLIFFINATIENPAFSSQTKDTLTTKVDKFGSKYEPSQAFLKKLAKCGIVEQVIQLAKFKENSNLKKTDGKKQIKIQLYI